MRNAVGIFLLIVLTVGLSSCEKIKGWFDVEVDTTIEGELSILTDQNELKSAEDYGFNESVTVQLLNDDLYDYEDEITGFRTSNVTFEVLAVDSSDVILRAGTEFLIYNEENPGLVISIPSDWVVEVGAALTLDEAALDVLDDILDDMIEFTISATGSCNKGNVTIELRYGFETTAIANPL
ncbi:MAG: hypothetical protein P1P86_12575 [Bacteroidales bacterium]|nr:hypothetical protein [Bacteroidales bacterium]